MHTHVVTRRLIECGCCAEIVCSCGYRSPLIDRPGRPYHRDTCKHYQPEKAANNPKEYRETQA